MHFSVSITLLSVLLPLTLANDIPILVGAGAKLAFDPSIVTAAVGDTLTFSFFPKNHSVAQSSFADPCHPLAGGFYSGFQPLSAGPGPVQFVVRVNDTKPIWIYCSQAKGNHCQAGMVMVVNGPASPSADTLDAYKLSAAKSLNSTSPPNIAGGMFVLGNITSTATGSVTASSVLSSSTASSGSSNYGSSFGASSSGHGSSGVVSFTGAASRLTSTYAVVSGIVAFIIFALL